MNVVKQSFNNGSVLYVVLQTCRWAESFVCRGLPRPIRLDELGAKLTGHVTARSACDYRCHLDCTGRCCPMFYLLRSRSYRDSIGHDLNMGTCELRTFYLRLVCWYSSPVSTHLPLWYRMPAPYSSLPCRRHWLSMSAVWSGHSTRLLGSSVCSSTACTWTGDIAPRRRSCILGAVCWRLKQIVFYNGRNSKEQTHMP